MLDQNLDDRLCIIHIILGYKLELFKLRVLTHQILDWVFQRLHYFFQVSTPRRSLDVEDHFMINSQFLGDRQGIF